MKDYYVLLVKNIKDLHYSDKVDNKGKPFKRYVYKNIDETTAASKDYVGHVQMFTIEKLLIYQERFKDLEEFHENEKKILTKTFKDEEKLKKQLNILTNSMKYAIENKMIILVGKTPNNISVFNDIYIRTALRPINNIEDMDDVRHEGHMYYMQYFTKDSNGNKVSNKVYVENQEEYFFFIALQEENLMQAYNHFITLINSAYRAKIYNETHYYYNLFLKYLVKNANHYNLYSKE